MTQPLCRWCGCKIRKRTTTVYITKEHSAYTHKENVSGGGLIRHMAVGDSWPMNKADCQKLTNLQVLSVEYEDIHDPATKGIPGADAKVIGRRVRKFSEWDGESYESQLFCNGDHAKDFGYATARMYTTDAYRKAKAKQTNVLPT